jgi:hypothetical protein
MPLLPFSPWCVFAALLATGLGARAEVRINWVSPSSAIKMADGTTNAPSLWLAQLIFSPDAAVSPVDPLHPFAPTGGEAVLAERPLNLNSLNGRIFSADPVLTGDSRAGGYVYTRVFNVNAAGGHSVRPTHFGDSPVGGPLQVTTTDPNTIHSTLSHTTVTVNRLLPPMVHTENLTAAGVTHLRLAWPSFYAGWRVVQSPLLGPTAVWIDSGVDPVLDGGSLVVEILPDPETRMYYRLWQP